MAGAQPRTSCRSLFKQLDILPALCQYILSLKYFIIHNQETFYTNSSIHNTGNHHLRPNANLSCFQSTIYAGMKIFNRIPPSVTILKYDKGKFKAALRKYFTYIPFTL